MSHKKILLVDDSSTILMMERMILAKYGYVLTTAGNGEEALAKAEQEQPDLILMDLVMPHMNGLDAVRHLHDNEHTSSIPVIMVTTRAEANNVETAFSNGASDYVTKPINSLDLVTKIRSCLGE
ncbi:MAG TPA: response regulator [Thermoanaerobaculia bacterium]|nr:response regulator [Thermoanaerobaculia bacterium]